MRPLSRAPSLPRRGRGGGWLLKGKSGFSPVFFRPPQVPLERRGVLGGTKGEKPGLPEVGGRRNWRDNKRTT